MESSSSFSFSNIVTPLRKNACLRKTAGNCFPLSKTPPSRTGDGGGKLRGSTPFLSLFAACNGAGRAGIQPKRFPPARSRTHFSLAWGKSAFSLLALILWCPTARILLPLVAFLKHGNSISGGPPPCSNNPANIIIQNTDSVNPPRARPVSAGRTQSAIRAGSVPGPPRSTAPILWRLPGEYSALNKPRRKSASERPRSTPECSRTAGTPGRFPCPPRKTAAERPQKQAPAHTERQG